MSKHLKDLQMYKCILVLRSAVRAYGAPFVSKVRESRPWRTFVTGRWDGILKQTARIPHAVCFKSPSQRPVTDVRPRLTPTARSDGLLKQSVWGIRAVCFKSPSQRPVTDVRPRPAPTARSDGLLKQSAWGIRAVCFKSSPQQPVTASRPRPARTARSDRLLKQSAWGIRAVCFKSPFRRPVTARSDELLKQTAPHTSNISRLRIRVIMSRRCRPVSVCDITLDPCVMMARQCPGI